MQFDPGMEYRPDWGASKGMGQPKGGMPPHGPAGGPIQRGQVAKGMQPPPGSTPGMNPLNPALKGVQGGGAGPPGNPKDDKS